MLTIIVPMLVLVIGLAVAVVPSRFTMLGLIAFGVGLWWTLAVASHHVVHIS